MMRDERIDVAKGALILLVVCGHFLEGSLQSGGGAEAVYAAIYLFHMPLFVALSGYLSSRRITLRKVFRRIVVPLIIAEIAYRILDALFFGRNYPVFQPYWILWYLVSLAVWLAVWPVWQRLRFPLATAIVVGLCAGFPDFVGLLFSLSRIFVFFPFFVIGAQLSGKGIPIPTRLYLPVLGVVAAASLFAIGLISGVDVRYWLYGSFGYAALNASPVEGVAIRALHYLGAGAASLVFLAILPQRQRALEWFGRNTLGIYLMHGPVALFFWSSALNSGAYPVAVAALLGCATCGALAVLSETARKRWRGPRTA